MLAFDDTAFSEARILHPGNDGYFFVGQKIREEGSDQLTWRQKGLHLSSLEQAVTSVRNMPDTYISQASFVRKVRQVSALKAISCCFVDLDCYNLNIIPNDEAVEAVLKIADSYGIPRPTIITKSGCGLYAKWILDRPLSDTHLHAWNQVQSILISLFSPMGADIHARDAARVLRVTSTVNSKNGETVEVARNSGEVHNFTELAKTLSTIPLTTGLALTKRKTNELKKKIALLEDPAAQDLSHLLAYSDKNYTPITMAGGIGKNIKGLNWSRFLDIRDLMIVRGGAKRGSRDLFIFWMATMLGGSGVINPSNFWNEIEQLLISFPNTKDFDPLRDGSLDCVKGRIEAAFRGEKWRYKGVDYSPLYTPNNETLLNAFEITSEEEKRLRTIISTDEKRRRSDEKIPGRAERRIQRNDAKEAAIELRSQGLNASQIAEQMSLNRSTVSRWFKSADAKPPVENRDRWTPERMQEWRESRRQWLAAQAAQIAAMKESTAHLASARDLQGTLRLAIKVTSMMEKAKQVSQSVCNQGGVSVSSVSKIHSLQSENSDADDHYIKAA